MSDEPKTITEKLAEAEARIAALEAAGDRMADAAVYDGRCCGPRYYTPDQHSDVCEVARWLEVRDA